MSGPTGKPDSRLSDAKRALLAKRLKGDGGAEHAWRLSPRAPDASIPLTFAQQRLWFLEQIAPGSPAYHISASLHLNGPLNIDALRGAFNRVVARHESLRTTFRVEDGEPVQIVAPSLELEVPVIAPSRDPETGLSRGITQLAIEHQRAPFSLTDGPLIRTSVISFGPERHALLICMHHIVSDGWSLGLLLNELTGAYNALRRNEQPNLPPLKVQYPDYSIWQRRKLQGEELERRTRYWDERLSSIRECAEIPADNPRGAVMTYHGATHAFLIPRTLSEQLRRVGRAHDATMFITLLALYKTLIYRLTANSNVAVGSVIAARDRSEIEPIIGFFANTLVMRSDLRPEAGFADAVRTVRDTVHGAHAHADEPFEYLVERYAPARDLSRNPLFQTMFVLQNVPDGSLGFDGLDARPVDLPRDTAKFDLSLAAYERDEGVIVSVEYNTDLFTRETIERLGARMIALGEATVADTQRPIAALDILPDDERELIVSAWNQTDTDLGPETTIPHLILSQCDETPDRTAISFGDDTLSYDQLRSRAAQVANHLRTLGVGPGSIVGVCLERSLDMVPAMLGVMIAGGAYLPLDPGYPTDRLAYMIENSESSIVLAQRRTRRALPRDVRTLIVLDQAGSEIDAAPRVIPDLSATPSDLAYVIYTSGSTGKPKGVMIEHRSVANRLLARQLQFSMTPDDRILHKTPTSFDISVWEIFWALTVGAQLVIAPPDAHRHPEELLRVIEDRAVTMVHFVPTMLRPFLEALGPGDGARLHSFFSGGEALPPAIARALSRALPHVRIINEYGPTEATIDAITWECPNDTEVRRVPIGKPTPNVRAYILDPSGEPTPIGVPGELHLGGIQVARGYLNGPDLTEERFIPDPFAGHGRLYKTGDLARWMPDANIDFLGRMDGQVKVRGVRVELGEIEAVLRSCDGVKDAVAAIKKFGPGDERVVGYVIAVDPDTPPTVTDLRRHARAMLPDAMVPSAFSVIESIPQTPSGKSDRRALPMPQRTERGDDTALAPPTTPTEIAFASLWADALKADRVGLDDNFFDLGGHSLLAIKVLTQMRERHGAMLHPREIMTHTLGQLATLADRRGAAPANTGGDHANA